MTKHDIIKDLKRILPEPNLAEKTVNRVFRLMSDALKKQEKVMISSFGAFLPIEKKPAVRRNPKTNETVHTGIRKKVRFKPSKKLIS